MNYTLYHFSSGTKLYHMLVGNDLQYIACINIDVIMVIKTL